MGSERIEAELKSAAMQELRYRHPNFVIVEYATVGAPDREVVGRGISTRWEFKHGTPSFTSVGIQELMMLRLSAAGHARYVIWEERRGIKRTLIVHPKDIGGLKPEAWCAGFDHKWLVEQIGKAHGA